MHVHTTASDGMMSPAMVMNYVAASTSLDVVAITDHNTMEGWERAREFQDRRENEHLHSLTLVPGIEISSRDGHVIGLWVHTKVPRGLSADETVDAIHEQGGIALAPHPFAWMPGNPEFTGVGRRFLEIPFDGVETRNSTPSEWWNNPKTQRLNRASTRPIAEYGGSDAHFLWAIGRTWTVFPGRTGNELRTGLLGRQTYAEGFLWGPFSLLAYFRDRWRWRRFCRTHGVRLHDL